MAQELVLVTGGSGFVGSHCVATLLHAGYAVRTTVRSLEREADVWAMMQRAGVAANAPLTFAEADLEKDAGWAEAAWGCAYVLHVASPLPMEDPKDENEVIRPAVEGTLRVLRAARDAGTKRVVLTSSFAAIGYGHDHHPTPFSEKDWTDPKAKGISTYVRSKTLAERAAWEFVKREGSGMELVSINPPAIFGPALGKDLSGSISLISMQLTGKMPLALDITFGAVDVRDVAELEVLAMTHPDASGKRFLAASSSAPISLLGVAEILRSHLGDAAKKTPKRMLPNWLVRMLAPVVPMLRGAVSEIGKKKLLDNSQALSLGWKPRATQEAVVSAGESLVALGVLPH